MESEQSSKTKSGRTDELGAIVLRERQFFAREAGRRRLAPTGSRRGPAVNSLTAEVGTDVEASAARMIIGV
jgi:hypothetical protein